MDDFKEKMDEFQDKVEDVVADAEERTEDIVQDAEARMGIDPAPQSSGQGLATASLVCGIVGIVCWFFGWSSIASIILGIVGLVLASKSKMAGCNDPKRTAGFILSIIALVGGAIFFVACVACVACVGAAAALS